MTEQEDRIFKLAKEYFRLVDEYNAIGGEWIMSVEAVRNLMKAQGYSEDEIVEAIKEYPYS